MLRQAHADAQKRSSNVNEAFKYLSKSKAGRALVADFNATGATIIEGIDPEIGLSNTYNDETNTVYWDPSEANNYKAGIGSPALTLAHEMSHAVRYHSVSSKQWVLDMTSPVREVGPNTWAYSPSPEEIRATNHINIIERELGEPVRSGYRDGSAAPSRGIAWSCIRASGGC